MDEYAAACNAVAETVRTETASLVHAGVAEVVVGTDEGAGHELRPRTATACRVSIYVQSQHEVSLWPYAPGTDRAPTVDISRTLRLCAALSEYLAAIAAGRVELTLRRGSSDGRFRVWLSDGSCATHLYNVLVGWRVGRGQGWETFRPDRY